MRHPCTIILQPVLLFYISWDDFIKFIPKSLGMILNITDGILGESLGIQTIATFNTYLRNIDPALKRKGRLKSSYEFKALEVEKANKLLQNEGINEVTPTPLPIAEIYNFKEEQQMKEPEGRAVGFR